jgi:transcriptional regulator CBF1
MIHDMDDGGSDGEDGNESKDTKSSPPATTSGKRGGRSATMGSEEWTRQRKDNHVSVHREYCYIALTVPLS